MMPILFHVPFIHTAIYSYGLMMVIGFLLGIQLSHKRLFPDKQ